MKNPRRQDSLRGLFCGGKTTGWFTVYIYTAGRDGRRPQEMKKLRVSGAFVSNLVLTQQSAAEAGVHSRFHVYEVSGIEEVLAAHDLAQSFKVQFLELLVVYAQ